MDSRATAPCAHCCGTGRRPLSGVQTLVLEAARKLEAQRAEVTAVNVWRSLPSAHPTLLTVSTAMHRLREAGLLVVREKRVSGRGNHYLYGVAS